MKLEFRQLFPDKVNPVVQVKHVVCELMQVAHGAVQARQITGSSPALANPLPGWVSLDCWVEACIGTEPAAHIKHDWEFMHLIQLSGHGSQVMPLSQLPA